MNNILLPSAIFFLLIITIVIVVFYFMVQIQKRTTPKNSKPQQHSRKKLFTAQEAKIESQRLLNTGAQWSEILITLNPHNDSQSAYLLQILRGPHMFNPRTALAVISHGCDIALCENPNATALSALQEAKNSMEKVTQFGD